MVNIDNTAFNRLLEEFGVGANKQNCCPYIQDNISGNYGANEQVITYFPIDYDFDSEEYQSPDYAIDHDFDRDYIGLADFIEMIKTFIVRNYGNLSIQISRNPKYHNSDYTLEMNVGEDRLRVYGQNEVEAFYIMLEAIYFITGKLGEEEVYPFDIKRPNSDWVRYEDGEFVEIEDGN